MTVRCRVKSPAIACAHWALVLALILTAHASLSATDAPKAGWLFPVLRYGPNNQIRDLKRSIALAKYLGRGIILTGLFRHHADEPAYDGPDACFPEHWGRFISLEKLIDRVALSQWLPVSTVNELKQRENWNGQLGCLMYGKNVLLNLPRDINRTFGVMGVTITPQTSLSEIREPVKCRSKKMRQINIISRSHRYLGVVQVQLGDGERPDRPLTRNLDRMSNDEQACQETVNQAMRVLQFSSWLRETARKYADRYVAGGPYLAVHVRPYPDTCLELWKDGTAFRQSNTTLRLGACLPELQTLNVWFASCVHAAASAYNLSSVVVICHPAISTAVTNLLSTVNIRAQFVNGSVVEDLAACRDGGSSFLVMVEQQLATQAAVFLGTGRSSITQNIVYARQGTSLAQSADSADTSRQLQQLTNLFLEEGRCAGLQQQQEQQQQQQQ